MKRDMQTQTKEKKNTPYHKIEYYIHKYHIKTIVQYTTFFVLLLWITIFFIDKTEQNTKKWIYTQIGGVFENNTTQTHNNHTQENNKKNNQETKKENTEEKQLGVSTGILQHTSSEFENDILVPETITVTNDTAILLPITEEDTKDTTTHTTNEQQHNTNTNIQNNTLQTKRENKEDTNNKEKEEKNILKHVKNNQPKQQKKQPSTHVLQNTEKKVQQEQRKKLIKDLEKQYNEKKRKEDLKKLIQKLIQNYDFEKAKSYVKNIPITKTSIINPSLIIYTYFNTLDFSNSSEIYRFGKQLDELVQKNTITNDEYHFYKGILALKDANYQQANTHRSQSTNFKSKAVIQKIQYIEKQMQAKQGMPKYYQNALVAVEFLKAGYFSIAKHLAMKTLDKNIKYPLPYQILAYADFLTNHLESAIGYFQKLTKIDPAKHNSYKYMMGISYYRNKKYHNAIIHLSQIKHIHEFRTDALRYLILAYKHINDLKRVQENYKILLKENNIQTSDFLEYYSMFLIQPYIQKGEITLHAGEKTLTENINTKCKQGNIAKNKEQRLQMTIYCEIGDIGTRIAKNQRDTTTEKHIKNIITKIHNTENTKDLKIFLYQALGDYYYRRNQFTLAKDNYLKASIISDNTKSITNIKNKLRRLQQEHQEHTIQN